MPQYRISNAARADIIDILKRSQTQFGDQARRRYQALILAALQALPASLVALGAMNAIRSHQAFAAITLTMHASRPNTLMGQLRAHAISCSIAWPATT
ncbi:hypothetical protein ABMA08_18115 [Pseudomonas yamanorum]